MIQNVYARHICDTVSTVAFFFINSRPSIGLEEEFKRKEKETKQMLQNVPAQYTVNRNHHQTQAERYCWW